MPKVSIIMPVYNAEKYLDATIQSILNQSFEDFEFLIVDDKSSDNSLEIIRKYNDKRIVLYKNEKNIGYVKSLNRLIDLANGEYIARQDNDDISFHDRIKKQVNFLDKNTDISLCGTNYIVFGNKNFKSKVPLFHEQIRSFMLFNNPICHPTVMYRKSIFALYNINKYDELFCPAEDYALWFEVSKQAKLANLSEPLLLYRIHNNNTSNLKRDIQVKNADIVRSLIFENYFKHKLSTDESKFFNLLFNQEEMSITDLVNIESLLLKIKSLNFVAKSIDEKVIEKIIFSFFISATLKNKNLPFITRNLFFFKSKLYKINLLISSVFDLRRNLIS